MKDNCLNSLVKFSSTIEDLASSFDSAIKEVYVFLSEDECILVTDIAFKFVKLQDAIDEQIELRAQYLREAKHENKL